MPKYQLLSFQTSKRWKMPKKNANMPDIFFSRQTELKNARFLESGLKHAKLATLKSEADIHGCQLSE